MSSEVGGGWSEGGSDIGKGAFAGVRDGMQPRITEVVTTAQASRLSRIPVLRRLERTEAPVPPPPEIIRVPESPWQLTARPLISIADMHGGDVPERYLNYEKGTYEHFAKEPLAVFSAQKDGSDTHSYVVVGTPLNAKETNSMLYFCAPSVSFGLDTKDLITDWAALYRKAYNDRLVAHRAMPGFTEFEKIKDPIINVISQNHNERGYAEQDETDVLVPVLQFSRTKKGGMEISLDPLDHALVVTLREALPNMPHAYNPGMGIVHLAAYSQGNTVWPTQSGYHDWNATNHNQMSATQAIGLVYREIKKSQLGDKQQLPEEDPQKSPLLKGFADYADTGIVPKLIVPHTKTADELAIREKEREDNRAALHLGGEILMTASAIVAAYGLSHGIFEFSKEQAQSEQNRTSTSEVVAFDQTQRNVDIVIFGLGGAGAIIGAGTARWNRPR